jgi:hypothetical protein
VKAVPLAVLFTVAISAGAQQYLGTFQGLSENELSTLNRQKPLIRQATSARRLSLAIPGAFPDEIRRQIRALGANYVGEVIMVVQGSDSQKTLADVARFLADVEGYVDIPYWSKQNNRTYTLFDKIKVVERTRQPAGETVVTDQHMEPFADYRARYAYEMERGELRFRSENLTAISYKGFASVAPGNMVWYLYGFPKGGATFLYGVGAVKTFDLLGLFSERLKTSFMGRIQAFFSYIYEKRTKGAGKNG